MFRPTDFTFDQFDSGMPIAWLREKMVEKKIYDVKVYEETGTNKKNWMQWEVLKTALNLDMVHIAPDCEDSDWSAQELKFLSCDQEKQNPKVVRQTSGPVTRKDCADSIREVVYHFLGSFLEDFINSKLEQPMLTGSQGGYQIGGRSEFGPRGNGGGFEDFYKSRGTSGGFGNPARGMSHRNQRR